MLNANTYITEDKGIGGTIRNRYEDFYVEEIPAWTNFRFKVSSFKFKVSGHEDVAQT